MESCFRIDQGTEYPCQLLAVNFSCHLRGPAPGALETWVSELAVTNGNFFVVLEESTSTSGFKLLLLQGQKIGKFHRALAAKLKFSKSHRDLKHKFIFCVANIFFLQHNMIKMIFELDKGKNEFLFIFNF